LKVSAFKILIITIILTVLGVFIIPRLSVKLNPTSTLPSINVSFSWPNAAPYVIEREITSKLEGGLSLLKGLSKIESTSNLGGGSITLSFDKYTDIDVARFETATIIRQLYKKLPERASYPTLRVNRPDADEQRAFLSYSINAPERPMDIQETVKLQLEPILGAIPSIDKLRIFGANQLEYLFQFNNDKLLSLGLVKQDLIQGLSQAFDKASLGDVSLHGNYITLALQPMFTDLDWHIPIKKVGDRLIYLDDVATVKALEQETQSYYRINAKNSITLNLYATKNANTIRLAEQVEKTLAALKTKLPANYTILKTNDSTIFLKKELDKIYERSIYTVIILLVFILLVSRSWRYLLVTLLSLIANISIAFLLYYFFEVEIQMYSLAGITISLGLIIDNSIVMIDHLRHQKNKRVFIPILASTLTTIGALSIIYFLDEMYRVNLVDFAMVIIINLGVSLLVALFLIPALLEKIELPVRKEKPWSIKVKSVFYALYEKLIKGLLRFKKLAIVLIILIFGLPFFMLPAKMENNDTWVEKTYNSTIGNEWFKENIRPFMDRYLGGTFRLFSAYVFESGYYGRNEETRLTVTASMEKGATVHQMNEVMLEVENYLLQFNEIEQFTTNVSSGDRATINIIFKEAYADSSFPFILKNRLIRKALDFSGMDWGVYGVGRGFSNGGGMNDPVNFTVKAKGYNYTTLNEWGDSLKTALLKHPRIQKVNIRGRDAYAKKPSFEFRYFLDKERLALTSANPSIIVTALQNLTLSKQADLQLNIAGRYSPIRFESTASKTYDLWHIENAPLDSIHKPVVLKDIASVYKAPEEESIYKENQEYLRTVAFQYTGSGKFGKKFLDEQLDILRAKLPLGYTFEQSSYRFFLGDKAMNYTFLLVLVLGIIYFICAILFESFKQPFIILSVIPISFIGVFLTFYWLDFNFDQGGMASFVLLSGITVNASIFILTSFNKLKKQFPNKEAISLYLQAFKQKIFPIMLTVISTILGFIPFVKDGQNEVFWFALGAGTIGGLIFSLVGILLYLPLFSLKRGKPTQ